MKLESLKSRLNNQKVWLFKGKITKSGITFCENKPNVKIGNINISSLITSKYAKMANNQSSIIDNHLKSKPNQTQFKANSNPICQKAKMNLRNVITMNYEDFVPMALKKQTQTNPKQTQFVLSLACCGIFAWKVGDKTLKCNQNDK